VSSSPERVVDARNRPRRHHALRQLAAARVRALIRRLPGRRSRARRIDSHTHGTFPHRNPMSADPLDELMARIERLERLFAALRADPASAAWREIETRLAPAVEERAPEEPRTFIRGGYGEEMDAACAAIAAYFAALPGWQADRVDADEVVHLAGFFAFIALASSATAPLPRPEAATGARATVARRFMFSRATADRLPQQLNAFKRRLNEYSALWAGVLKGSNSFGAFAERVFANVRIGERTRDGYLEHLNGFPGFCERRITAFHEAVAPTSVPAPAGESSGQESPR